MNKPKKFPVWRIVGIVVTVLVIIGGFVGAYILGVSRGADLEAGDVWMNPAQRMDQDGEGYYPMMPMSGYGRNMGRGVGSVGSIFGFFLMIMVIGAFIRLVFFPFRRMARSSMWAHRYHDFNQMPPRGYHGPHGPWDQNGSGESDQNEEPQNENYSKE